MKCHELIRTLDEFSVTLSLGGGGKILATPAEKAVPLLEDMKRYRMVMMAMAAGTHRDESFRESVRRIRISCPDLLTDGMCHGCIFCCEWSPVWIDGEGPSGICAATPSTGGVSETLWDNRRKK